VNDVSAAFDSDEAASTSGLSFLPSFLQLAIIRSRDRRKIVDLFIMNRFSGEYLSGFQKDGS
jgi:hypothetical protein